MKKKLNLLDMLAVILNVLKEVEKALPVVSQGQDVEITGFRLIRIAGKILKADIKLRLVDGE